MGRCDVELDATLVSGQELLDPLGLVGRGQVWLLQIRKPWDSTRENHFVELRGIPPLLVPAGAPLLVPAGD